MKAEKKNGPEFPLDHFEKMVRLAGIEPTTPWFVAKYSIQLSYSRPRHALYQQWAKWQRCEEITAKKSRQFPKPAFDCMPVNVAAFAHQAAHPFRGDQVDVALRIVRAP